MNPVPHEMTNSEYIDLNGFEKYVINRLKEIEQRLKNIEKLVKDEPKKTKG